MSRCVAILVVGTILTSASSASADHHHKEWWKYMKGEWTYEIGPPTIKGTVTWRRSAKGNALLGRFEDSNGVVSSEIGGWRKDTQKLVATGYGSAGNYWHLELKVTADTLEGPHVSMSDEGRKYEGHFKMKKIDENHFEWTSKGKTSEGEELVLTGKFTRKKPDATKKKK